VNGTDWPAPRAHTDPQRLHEERLRHLEDRQAEAFRLLAALRGQIRVLRTRVGLPPDPEP
jgi:hypothetical protein